MQVDMLDDYNVVWESPSANAAGSMPCGGGDIGMNVWAEAGDILIYLQRSGSLAEQNEYLKLGRVRLRLDPNPFGPNAEGFRQELVLREGHVEIRGRVPSGDRPAEVSVRVWAEVGRPVVRLEVDSTEEVAARVSFECWRNEDEWIPDDLRRRSFMSLFQYPGEVLLRKDVVDYTDDGSVLFYHRNPASDTVVDLLIRQQGLEAYRDRITDDLRNRTFGGLLAGKGFAPAGTSEGSYQGTPFRGWSIASEAPARRHEVRIATHIAQTETLGEWQQAVQDLAAASARDIEEARARTTGWWADFWERSWIVIQPGRPDPSSAAWRAARNYTLFRYQLGCNAFGEYPSKFNGGSFTVDASLTGERGHGFGPDWRDWGGGIFTAQNQRLLYWPMLKTGDADAILPQMELYRKALPGARARVEANFGHDGAVYSEYIGVPGIAAGFGYGWESGPRSRGEEIPFGDPRADAGRGYNDLVERGVMANHCISYHWESQLEHAYMILEYHRYTGADIARFVPFIENAVVFFDEHYRARERMRSGREHDENGRLVIYPSTACESYRGAKNPSDVIAGLHACIDSILDLDEGLLALRDKAYYRALRETLPGYPYAEVEGDRVFQPAESWKFYQNVECPQFYPLFPFNRFDLLGEDADHLKIFRDTWRHGNFPKDMVISWHQDGIFYARMGMTSEAAAYNLLKLDDAPRRFPTFWGPGHDWVPDHNHGGSGMIGLQEMLLQAVGSEIRLLPAWPADWDVDFKLHAPEQTIVEGRVAAGRLVELKVTPESRRSDVIVSAPFTPDPAPVGGH